MADQAPTATDASADGHAAALLSADRELQHDFGVVARLADRVAVVYAGEVVESEKLLCAQGRTIKDATVYQDNKSAILLEKNGRASSSK